MKHIEFANTIIYDNEHNFDILRAICAEHLMSRIYSRWAFIDTLQNLLYVCGFKTRLLNPGDKLQIRSWVGEDEDYEKAMELLNSFQK